MHHVIVCKKPMVNKEGVMLSPVETRAGGGGGMVAGPSRALRQAQDDTLRLTCHQE
ncbi:hypothetical protein C8P68_105275 [Mucilaginibacter yixingensis]|uniref:Uncharacterized protein n=1 Tax=Mucilaginibacter yixingensis TaxID=1295612 RepID=A0A2T5J8I2_9SPHI|nr:hypothetical protein C8P68_105275 [Mucilaginibacter yixingensis]